MEKNLNKSEKKTTDEDDEDNSNIKNTSKKVKKSDSEDSPKKPNAQSSFFVVDRDGEMVEHKKKTDESDINEKEDSDIENLNEDEVHEVIQIIIDEREQSISDELATTNDESYEELEAVAVGIFLESLRHEALSENEITADTIDQAYLESLEDLDIQTEPEESDNTDDEINNRPAPNVANSGNFLPPSQINTTHRTPPRLSPQPPLPPNNQNVTLGGPPNPPHNNQPRQNRNIIPIPVPVPLESGAALAAGTITGYILGRRTKKNTATTNKVLSVDKKLENQVKQLQTVIYGKESKLRADVRKSWHGTDRSTVKPVIIAERRKKRIELKEELKRREELVNNPKVEKIGNFSLPVLKIYRERRLPDGMENHPKRKSVEIMTVTELLEKSGHVKYNKWTIEELYKAHRLTEKILRQVTKEYMRGGPYKQTLAREVLPDPKIVAEKYKLVDSAHNNSASTKTTFKSSGDIEPGSEQNILTQVVPRSDKVQNSQSSIKKSLPRPWIAMVSAIATIIALGLIYLL